MRHRGAYACLRADSEVVHHAVLGGEVFGANSHEEGVKIHKALVDDNLAITRVHIPRAVRIAEEHGAQGLDAGLLYARRGNANDAHGCLPPQLDLVAVSLKANGQNAARHHEIIIDQRVVPELCRCRADEPFQRRFADLGRYGFLGGRLAVQIQKGFHVVFLLKLI